MGHAHTDLVITGVGGLDAEEEHVEVRSLVTKGMVQLIESEAPNAVVAPGTDRGHEVLAHVAARTELPMAANCIDVSQGDASQGDAYQVTRQRWGGSLLQEATLDGDPKLFTVAAYLIPPGEEPADAVGGAVGGSRVATNNGSRPHSDQIGNRIAPDLYIACGISGAIQYMVGCKGAKTLLAISYDPEAPIIDKADHAVIGDLHEVLPAITEEVRERSRGGGKRS